MSVAGRSEIKCGGGWGGSGSGQDQFAVLRRRRGLWGKGASALETTRGSQKSFREATLLVPLKLRPPKLRKGAIVASWREGDSRKKRAK